MSSVVVAGAVIGAVVGGGSSMMGIRKGNKNLIKAYREKMKYVVMNYNYAQNNLDRQQQSLRDEASMQLLQLNLNAMNNQAQVRAAIGESGYDGRNASKMNQVITGQNIRQKDVAKEAYEVASYDIRSKKDALYIQTKAGLDQEYKALGQSFTHGTQAFMQVAGAAAQGAAIGAFTAGAGSAIANGGMAATATKTVTPAMLEAGSGSAVASPVALETITKVGGTEVIGSTTLNAGANTTASTAFNWGRAMESFNAYYDKYGAMFNNFMSLTNQINVQARRGYYY